MYIYMLSIYNSLNYNIKYKSTFENYIYMCIFLDFCEVIFI